MGPTGGFVFELNLRLQEQGSELARGHREGGELGEPGRTESVVRQISEEVQELGVVCGSKLAVAVLNEMG